MKSMNYIMYSIFYYFLIIFINDKDIKLKNYDFYHNEYLFIINNNKIMK